ncbi:hypothetical protein GCM10020255_056090 [Rhodococcus baikonurensis]
MSDLRSRDVATGGQGAPLVSAFDVLWLNGRTSGSVALNLGGIANVTAPGGTPTSTADGAAEPIAFDTGPANALIDAAVSEFTAGSSGSTSVVLWVQQAPRTSICSRIY